MSQKAQLPSLTGHRLKTRKRDEKKQYDPSGFRESILEGLNECNGDLEAVSKFLDSASSKLDYRRYGVTLIEILIAGGLLGSQCRIITLPLSYRTNYYFSPAPGGILIQDGDGICQTKTCLFGMASTMEQVKAWEQVFVKLERRSVICNVTNYNQCFNIFMMKIFLATVREPTSTDLTLQCFKIAILAFILNLIHIFVILSDSNISKKCMRRR